MSSPVRRSSSPSPEAREDSPLLTSSRQPDTLMPSSNDGDGRASVSNDDVELNGEETTAGESRPGRLFRGALLASFPLNSIILVLTATGFIIRSYLEMRRVWVSWMFDEALAWSAILSAFGLLYAGGNVVRRKQSGQHFPALVNVLIFGILAMTLLSLGPQTLLLPVRESPGQCTHGFSGCDAWLLALQVVIVLDGGVMILGGLTAAALAVLTFVMVYQSRSRHDGPGSNTNDRALAGSWSLPFGRISVEISINYGPPHAPPQALPLVPTQVPARAPSVRE